MKPVTVTIDVPNPRQEVYDFLDVMANHEPFTNHMLRDWHYSGPDRGIGSKARMTATAGGRSDEIEMEVVSAEPPAKIVERNIGTGGRRIGYGTYTLADVPGGGTRIQFEYSWQQVPLSERLAAPIVRAVMRRGNERAMKRLAEQLAQRSGATSGA